MIRLAGALLCIALFTGCAVFKDRPGGTASVITPAFFGIGEELALQLTANLRINLDADSRVLMTSLVNIDDLYETSRFGRTMTESLATRMFRFGYGVIEIRKAADVMIKNRKGELMLSRDTEKLADQQAVDAILTGTYALTPTTVIVNIKMLEAASHDVISVAGLELQRTSAINGMLAESVEFADAQLSVYER